MTTTIRASSITIDGPRAWLVVDYPAPLGSATIVSYRELNRLCEACHGAGWTMVRATTARRGQENCEASLTCRTCGGSKRHTFEIEVAGDVLDIEDGALRRYDGQAYRVHVVQVLPIVDNRSTATRFDRLRLGPEGVDYPATLMRANPSDDDLSLITLSADAAPGKFVAELAVHA
jgi:hypothetical protein